jgi:acyl carrier protein
VEANMENQIFEKVKTILNNQLSDRLDGKEISINDQLMDLDINSLAFIKIVVALEDEFDVEFQDEDLDISKFETVEDIVKYIESETNQ